MHYQEIAAGETDTEIQSIGTAGKKGDVIIRVIATVDTVGAGGAASLKDGTNAIPLVPASAPIGVHTVDLNITAKTGPWYITTGANVTAIVVARVD